MTLKKWLIDLPVAIIMDKYHCNINGGHRWDYFKKNNIRICKICDKVQKL